MKYTLTELQNVKHTYEAGQKKKVKISNSLNGINVVGTGANSIKDQLIEFNTGEYLRTIEDGSFKGCNKLSKVVLQANTVNIGENAFKDCQQLKDINIETVAFERIGNNAFENIGIDTLNMQLYKSPFGKFGKNIFKSCQQLKAVSLTANYVPEAMFEGCNNLTSIEITLSSGSSNTNQIDINALYGIPSLQRVAIRGSIDTLPCLSGLQNLCNVTLELDSQPKVPDFMFADTPKLKSVDFSNCITNLKQFSSNALNGSSLTSIVLKSVTKQDLNNSMKSDNSAAIVSMKTMQHKIVKKENTGNKYQYGKIYDDVDGVLSYAIEHKVPVIIINAWWYDLCIQRNQKNRYFILQTDMFYKWLACQKCLIVFSGQNIQIADIYNYFQGDEWETTMWTPYFAGGDTFGRYGGNVWSCGYGDNNIIRMQYDGTTQIQLYRNGVIPNRQFVREFNTIDMPTKVYKFYNTNIALKAKELAYDILNKTAVILDPHKLNRNSNNAKPLKRLYTASQYRGERDDVWNTIEWPYWNYVHGCLFVPYSVVDSTNNNYSKKADCTYTQAKYPQAFQVVQSSNLDKPAQIVQKAHNWNKLSKNKDVFKDVDVVKVENSQFFWFQFDDSTGKDGSFNRYYIPVANGIPINEDKIDNYSDNIKTAYAEYLKTDYANASGASDAGLKNHLKSLELQINTWLSAYQLDENLKPDGYVPNNMDYSYITTKPVPANCWNINHDCTFMTKGNVSVKWTQASKSFK